MYLISNGWISTSLNYVTETKKVLNKVLEDKISDTYVNKDDSVTFYIEDAQGDLSDSIEDAVSELAKGNILLNGRVYYSGDCAGCYVIEDGMLRLEEYNVISDVSDEDLWTEIERRKQKKKSVRESMDPDRLRDLMHGIIDYMKAGENPQSVLKFLIHRGFADDELEEFCFEKDAIAQAHDSDDGNEPEMVFC